MRIVIFKLNHLGDNVVFVPAVQALRRLEPGWQLTLLTTPSEAELYRGPLGPQEILTSPKHAFDKSHRRPWVLARWIWQVRRRRPDACLVSFDQGSAAHLVARLSGAPVRVGGNLENIRVRDSLTTVIPPPPDGRPVTWHWDMTRELLRILGSGSALPPDPAPPELEHLGTQPARASGRRRILVHAGASRPINQWPVENFAAVARSLARDHEVAWIEHGGTTGPAPSGTTPARPRSLGDLATQLRGADLFLGNNSGPMHLANALGVRGVAVTGPSALGWNPFWGRERWSVLRHPSLACAPCERLQVALEGCANLESPMACLGYWTAPRVEAACRAQLAGVTA